MESKDLLLEIMKYKIFAIARGIDPLKMPETFSALCDGGIRLIEITMNSNGAVEQVRRAVQLFEKDMVIGAGTVTDVEKARLAYDAGARFLVAPNLDMEVMEFAMKHDVLVIPGVMTPTEMTAAVKAGARAVKLFPAGALGIGYIKDVLAPLNNMKIIAVGGVNNDNATDFIKAGCIGVGVGSSLLKKSFIDQSEFDLLKVHAEKLVASCNRA